MSERPADFAVRERALDPTRSFIVQAPAGSGKTELLTRRYLRLLAAVEFPEEILAITFTRKAAAEMRTRVIGALALGSSPEPPPEPYRREMWQLAREALAADRRHGWELANHPARMRILTIDALNQALARRLPVLSGLGAPVEIAADAEALYTEAMVRVIEALGESGPTSDAIAALIEHLDNNLGLLERLLLPLMARREAWLDLGLLRLDPASLRDRLEDALELAVGEALAALTEAIPQRLRSELAEAGAAAAAVLETRDADSPIRACAGLERLPAANSQALAAWQGLATLLLTGAGDWRKPGGINVSLGFPADQKARKAAFLELLADLQQIDGLAERLNAVRALPPTRYPDEQWRVLEALLRVLLRAVAELDLVFSEAGSADFAAIALAARRALGSNEAPTDLALRLDHRLSHILVDEFQDTSRSQVELLKSLTAGWVPGDGRTVFCVGDPMQSIYRFRDAEVGLFLRVASDGLGDLAIEPLKLSVNFRSTRPLVGWANAAFATMLPRRDEPDRGAVAHARSDPSPGASEEGGVFISACVAGSGDARAHEARKVAEIVRATWQSDPSATIAVLVASRTHLPEILSELRSGDLPCRAVEIDPLARRPVVQDLLALTRALSHPGDRTAWLAVLRAPWCGLMLAELFALCANTSDTPVPELLADPQRLAGLDPGARERLERVWPLLAAALAERGRLGLRERVERCWNALGGPACARDGAELADADVYLLRLEAALVDLYGSSTVTEGERAVEVMTIHKAKGLEFDVVILPALERGTRADDAPLLRWGELPRVDGGASLLLAPIAPRGSDRDPVHHWLGLLEREKAAHERARLFYVAATRAARELHLLGAVEPGTAPGTLRAPARGSFLALAWPFLADEFTSGAVVLAEHAETPGSSPGPLCIRRLPQDWHPPEPERPFELIAGREPIEDAPLRP
ncbi:MAG TPA: UvrD-helicase domain-containing protein, partial [Steroidobacteraceae bacterium]|nr:UvrD-helicase domain-containing protein [Steroidobacteraceae bacterium]